MYGKNLSDEADFTFIQGEGEVLKDVVAPWFGTFFWIFGSISLMLVALGVVDYVARLVADVLKTLHLRDNERWSESKIYTVHRVDDGARSAVAVLLSGFDQPLVLLVLSRLPERDRDVHLLDPADQAQPQRAAAGDPGLAASGSACSCFAVLFYGFFAGWYVIIADRGALLDAGETPVRAFCRVCRRRSRSCTWRRRCWGCCPCRHLDDRTS